MSPLTRTDITRRFTKRHPGQATIRNKRWRIQNPKRLRVTSLKWQMKRYGLTVAQWQILYDAQKGLCAICHKSETLIIKGTHCRLAVDHDHTCCSGVKVCGRCVRGLLCHACNSGLRYFRDSHELLNSAGVYLKTGCIKPLGAV